jgi:hypothetical protein
MRGNRRVALPASDTPTKAIRRADSIVVGKISPPEAEKRSCAKIRSASNAASSDEFSTVKWRGIVSTDQLSLEFREAELTERRNAANEGVEAAYLSGNVPFGVSAGEGGGPSDQFGFACR